MSSTGSLTRLAKCLLSRGAWCAPLTLSLLPPLAGTAAAQTTGRFYEPDAILLNVTQQDLNRILQASFIANGGPSFEGSSDRASKGITGLRYRAELSEPMVQLGDDGQASLRFGILQADLEIGRVERRIGKRLAYCENAGATIEPARPLDVELTFRFQIEQDDLRLVPESVKLSDTKEHVRLVKPSRCHNTILPEWLLWWMGKPQLKHRLEKLDEVLLARAQRSASRLNRGEGLLREHWEFEAVGGVGLKQDLYVYPRFVDTRHGSLFVSLAGTSSERPPLAIGVPSRSRPDSPGSFVGLSGSFINQVLQLAVSSRDGVRRSPRGDLDRVLKSSSILALIPGLREVDSAGEISFMFKLHSKPVIEFQRAAATGARAGEIGSGPRHPASIHVSFSGIEMEVWKEGSPDALLGTLQIDSGNVTVLPFLNVLGGISFELVENDWRVSSRGLRFNDDLLAATIQELIFGEMFQTRYEPLAQNGLHVGPTEFLPRYFDLVDDYLIIELEAVVGAGVPAAAPNLHANR